jgi:hypothetical protein
MKTMYELFEMVGEGRGDYGSPWLRVAVVIGTRDAAKGLAAEKRAEKPAAHFHMFASKSQRSIGRLLWDFPPLTA